jgi:hypothetical protein
MPDYALWYEERGQYRLTLTKKLRADLRVEELPLELPPVTAQALG